MKNNRLYPPIIPYVTHTLDVGQGHSLYVEESGNLNGIPVLFLHGGPGAGSAPMHRRYFDPGKYRIIIFDQRGCGKSVPHAELKNNTTWDLVADIELIREKLGVDRWVIFGGSWGSTLSLTYAEANPERVLGLILRGIFLCRPQDIHWFYQHGASEIFPEAWEGYVKVIPQEKRNNMVKAYYEVLTGDDELARMGAAKAWSVWEGTLAKLIPEKELINNFGDPFRAMSLARIECHYFINDSFLETNQLLRDAGRLESIPGVIIHGRYDLVCPMIQAWELSKAWPTAQLKIIEDAGHYITERGITEALIQATDDMANKLA